MLSGARMRGFDQCHGFEIIAAANRRFTFVFQGDQQLAHGAGKGVREPAFIPDWAVKLSVTPGRETDRGGCRVGSLTPTQRADGQPVESFNPPLDVNVRGATLTRRPCPGIVDGNATQSVRVLQNVSAD